MGRLQSLCSIAAIGLVGFALTPASGAPRATQPSGSLLVPAECTTSCAKWEWVWAPSGRYKVKKCKWWVKTCAPDR